MKKILKISMMAVLTLLMVGCFAPTEDDLYGHWELKEMSTTWSLLGRLVSDTKTYDNDFDDHFSAAIYQFTENTLLIYENDPEKYTYKHDATPLNVGEDSLNFIFDLDIPFIVNPEFSFDYIFNGKKELTLLAAQYREDGGMVYKIEMIFKRYKGDIPPLSWTAALEDDIYEPDETSFTLLELNKVQDHTLTDDDEDFFSFTPEANKTYIFQVNSNLDVELQLEDADENEIANDDNSDQNIEGLKGPVASVIRWTALSSDEVYLVVQSDELGHYSIEVREDR
ncbi:MAG: hypothetical protein WCT23_04245 [Candidatus Neomarinimicrobiota bacterium]